MTRVPARCTGRGGIAVYVLPPFTWLEAEGIDDALIRPYSRHATRQSLEIYSRLALADAQQRYDDVISNFPSD